MLSILPPELDQKPYAGFAGAIGLVDSARATVTDLMDLLRETAVTDDGKVIEDERVVDAARWIMRELNDELERDRGETPVDRDIALLARTDGGMCFAERPYFTNDSVLAETWMDRFPILEADRGLVYLRNAFGLLDLSKAVTIRPIPMGVLPDTGPSIRANLMAAAPYLAALAVRTAPSQEGAVRARLPRIEVVACEELNLEYELEGQVKSREEPTSYLAQRIEGSGRGRRAIGTAFFEVRSDGVADFDSFAPQLAEFLLVPGLGDAFALLLSRDRHGRTSFLTSHGVTEAAVEREREILQTPPEEDVDAIIAGLEDLVGQPEETPDLGEGEAGRAAVPEQEGSQPEHEKEPPPPIDVSAIEAVEAGEGSVTPRQAQPGGGGTGGHDDQEQRRRAAEASGGRGEEAAFLWEQARIRSLGYKEDSVIWHSRVNAFAPYDIQSLDDDGQVIYIEVKSTTGSNEGSAFEISAAELRFASRMRDRYYIYRITRVNDVAPKIYRYSDPMSLIEDERAELHLSGARLRLPRANPEP